MSSSSSIRPANTPGGWSQIRRALYLAAGRCYVMQRGRSRWIRLISRLLNPPSGADYHRIAGDWLILDPADSNDAMYYFDVAGHAIAALLKRVARQGDFIIDGGANVGFVTLLAATAVGSEGLVYSIEPNPQLAQRLRDCRSRSPQVEVIEAALAKESGQVTFHIGSNSGWSSTRQNPTYQTVASLEVRAESIDQLIHKSRRERVRLLKLDLEGGEFDALLGARESLGASRIDCIVLEAEKHRLAAYGHSAAEVVEYLRSYGYSMVGAIRDEVLRESVDESDLDAHNQDLVFTRTGYALPDR